jgi:putative hydrolase of HD superfamily
MIVLPSRGIDSIIDTIRAAGDLKLVKRTGWVKKASIRNAESVADHSFRTAILGMLISIEKGLNPEKVMRMCLIHDLAESVIGDKMPEEKKSEREHRTIESQIVASIFVRLNPRTRRILISNLIELMEGTSREARLTWELDKLEMNLQRIDYLRNGYDKKKLSIFDSRKSLSKMSQKILDNYESIL